MESSPPRQRRAHNYPESKKLEVLQAYLAVGQLRLAARMCNVPETTAKVWKQSEWWAETESELRRSNHIKVSNRLAGLIEKAMTALDDRLSNGDYVLTKQGELIRKPVSAADASKVTAQLIDRQQVIDKAAIRLDVVDKDSITARLEAIKKELIEVAVKGKPLVYRPLGEVIDVEPISVAESDFAESTNMGGLTRNQDQIPAEAVIEEMSDATSGLPTEVSEAEAAAQREGSTETETSTTVNPN